MMNLALKAMMVGAIIGQAGPASGQGPDTYLKPDGTLKEPLTLTVAQGGIAGPRVTIYSIDADGAYTRKSHTLVIDKDGDEQKRGESVRKGKLPKEKLGEIAKVLASQKFVELPDSIGTEAKVNARTTVIDAGCKRATLSSGPQDGPGQFKADDPSGDAARDRFTAVARAIRETIDDEKK